MQKRCQVRRAAAPAAAGQDKVEEATKPDEKVEAKEADAKEDGAADPSANADAAAEDGAEKPPEGKEDGAGEDTEASAKGKWTCPACGASNFASASDCHKCGASQPSEGEAKLLQDKEKAAKELADKMDAFLRLQADLQNYRREHETEMARVKELGKQDALRTMLPFTRVVDEAIANTPAETEKEKALFQSYAMLFGKVKETFSTKFNAEPFTPEVGEEFDATRHKFQEFREPVGDEKAGVVVEVLTEGWKCDGKVLIPSEVVVTKSEADEEEESSEAPEEEEKEEEVEAAEEKAKA